MGLGWSPWLCFGSRRGLGFDIKAREDLGLLSLGSAREFMG